MHGISWPSSFRPSSMRRLNSSKHSFNFCVEQPASNSAAICFAWSIGDIFGRGCGNFGPMTDQLPIGQSEETRSGQRNRD